MSEAPKIGFDNEASKFMTAALFPLPKEMLEVQRVLVPKAPSALRLGAKYPAMRLTVDIRIVNIAATGSKF